MIDIVRDFLLEPVILIGVIVFIGLVLQRKGFEVVVKGTLKAMIGFMIISIGGNIISEAVASFGLMIQRGFHTTGLILSVEGISGIAVDRYGEHDRCRINFNECSWNHGLCVRKSGSRNFYGIFTGSITIIYRKNMQDR